ncbi:MAG: MaoC family dehydratase [Myxococcales bacterium]|jgi:acyl dehydratase|nr:MaoC family dehydratase [Myxococcales bacterium]
MSENAENAFVLFREVEGKESATGDWMDVNQELINQFADVTLDHQFIHIDPERAKAGPFGATIAHGFLTLSLLTHLGASANPENPDPARFSGMLMGINYGFEKVRFINPVKAGSRIRVHSLLSKVELKGNAIQQTRTMTVEIEGEQKPALVADWLTRAVYA